jgi:hypothetical protein
MGLLAGSLCFDLTLLTNIHNIPAYKASLAGDLLSLQDMGFIFELKIPDDEKSSSPLASPSSNSNSNDDSKHHADSTPSTPTSSSGNGNSPSLARLGTSKKLGMQASQISLSINDSSTPRYFAFTYGFIRDAVYQVINFFSVAMTYFLSLTLSSMLAE